MSLLALLCSTRVIHVVVSGRMFFVAETYFIIYLSIYLYIYIYIYIYLNHILFVHLSILAIVNNAAMNTGVQTCLWDSFLFSLDTYIEMGFLEHIYNLWGIFTLLSITAAPVHILTNSAEGFPFVPIITNTYLLSSDDSCPHRCEVTSPGGFDMHFLDE